MSSLSLLLGVFMTYSSKSYRRKRAYWAMILPPSLSSLGHGIPIVLSIVLSVSIILAADVWRQWDSQDLMPICGNDPWFWNALKNNIYIVLVSVFGQLPLGFIFAYFIYAKIVKAPEFWQGVLYVPNIISVIVVGLLWQTIFSPHGPIAEVINSIRVREFQNQLRGIFKLLVVSLSDDVTRRY